MTSGNHRDTGTSAAVAVLDRARGHRHEADAAEAALLADVLAWAELHVTSDPDGAETWGDSPVRLGGEGCPWVREFTITELATALHLSPSRRAWTGRRGPRTRLPAAPLVGQGAVGSSPGMEGASDRPPNWDPLPRSRQLRRQSGGRVRAPDGPDRDRTTRRGGHRPAHARPRPQAARTGGGSAAPQDPPRAGLLRGHLPGRRRTRPGRRRGPGRRPGSHRRGDGGPGQPPPLGSAPGVSGR